MPQDYKLPFISIEGERRISNSVGMNAQVRHSTEGTATADGQPNQSKKNKVKYSCPTCQTNIWAKPNINVICGDCEDQFVEQ